ncbi:unnamed protein product [Amoebophrya sp. A25]|nr:unnamed protein product [Amoebophrya sp. A25]|eukprot:GSA25T00003356001.1
MEQVKNVNTATAASTVDSTTLLRPASSALLVVSGNNSVPSSSTLALVPPSPRNSSHIPLFYERSRMSFEDSLAQAQEHSSLNVARNLNLSKQLDVFHERFRTRKSVGVTCESDILRFGKKRVYVSVAQQTNWSLQLDAATQKQERAEERAETRSRGGQGIVGGIGLGGGTPGVGTPVGPTTSATGGSPVSSKWNKVRAITKVVSFGQKNSATGGAGSGIRNEIERSNILGIEQDANVGTNAGIKQGQGVGKDDQVFAAPLVKADAGTTGSERTTRRMSTTSNPTTPASSNSIRFRVSPQLSSSFTGSRTTTTTSSSRPRAVPESDVVKTRTSVLPPKSMTGIFFSPGAERERQRDPHFPRTTTVTNQKVLAKLVSVTRNTTSTVGGTRTAEVATSTLLKEEEGEAEGHQRQEVYNNIIRISELESNSPPIPAKKSTIFKSLDDIESPDFRKSTTGFTGSGSPQEDEKEEQHTAVPFVPTHQEHHHDPLPQHLRGNTISIIARARPSAASLLEDETEVEELPSSPEPRFLR